VKPRAAQKKFETAFGAVGRGCRPWGHPARRGFTLIELLTAVVIFGIVLMAINTVFYGAIRLRTRTAEALDRSHAQSQILSLIRRDLQNLVPPDGAMAADFRIGAVSVNPNQPQTPGIEFFTSTGVIDDNAPWGDVQKVLYQLREPLDRSHALGKDLVRTVVRNLLATTMEEGVTQRLLNNVQAFEVLGFSGNEWRSAWDTTLTDTNIPTALRVRILLASDTGRDQRGRQPLELVVPLACQMPTNAISTSSSSSTQQ
jgi:type II secretion system protein J